MITRIDTGARSSKIVKHNGIAYLSGQVAEGDTIQEQTAACLAKIDALLEQAGSSREKMRFPRATPLPAPAAKPNSPVRF